MPLPIVIKGKTFFTLTNETLKAMLEEAERSFKIGKETGFALCYELEDKISSADRCTGEECQVEIINCRGKPTVGMFHTHPRGDSYPSWADIYCILHGYYFRKSILDCRIGERDKRLRCDIVKKPLTTAEFRKMKEKWEEFSGLPAFEDEEILERFEPVVDITLGRLRRLVKGVKGSGKITKAIR